MDDSKFVAGLGVMIAVPLPEVGATVEVVAVEDWLLSLSWALRLIAVDVVDAAGDGGKLLLKWEIVSLCSRSSLVWLQV